MMADVRSLAEAGVDPVGSANEFFKMACNRGHTDIVMYLASLPKVKAHSSTSSYLGRYLLRTNDIDNMRRLFLGDPPQFVFDPDCLYRPWPAFFQDPKLMTLLSSYDDQNAIRALFSRAVGNGDLEVVEGFLKNIDLFNRELVEASRRSSYIAAAAKHGDREMVLALLAHPRRCRRDRFRQQIRLLQRYSCDAYVTEDFLRAIASSRFLHTHFKYYLPSETLHRMFPDQAVWEADPFLRQVARSDENRSRFACFARTLENVYMNTFFDKSAGLFGDIKIAGGTPWHDGHFIKLISLMQKWRPLPRSRQLKTLIAHLGQVAEMVSKGKGIRRLLEQRLKDLSGGETYLFFVQGGRHGGYALATKKDNSRLNVKIFNSHHDIAAFDSAGKQVPYIEWDDLPLEELLSKDPFALPDSKFILSDNLPPRPPANLPEHMMTKGQRIGSCSAFKFWLVARHDLETLPRFLEFSVALHLAFIEDLTFNFAARMREWDAKITRGWLATIRTPHFEGQLLRDLRKISCDNPRLHTKLLNQMVFSMQRRYHIIYPEIDWNDIPTVSDALQWREVFLAEIDHPKGCTC
jgi:hypothetical protein